MRKLDIKLFCKGRKSAFTLQSSQAHRRPVLLISVANCLLNVQPLKSFFPTLANFEKRKQKKAQERSKRRTSC